MSRVTQIIGDRPYAIGVVGTFAAILIVVLPMLLVYSGREISLNRAHENSANLTSIMALDIESQSLFYDAQLQALVKAAEDPRTWKLQPDIRDELMFSSFPDAAYVDSQYVVGADGKVIASKGVGEKGSSLLLGDREYFIAHKNNPALGLFISHPFRSRINGKPAIALARRINNPDGSFNGVAFFNIRLEFMNRLFDRLNTHASGGATVLLNDGTILARKPYSDKDVDVNISSLPRFHEVAAAESGFLTSDWPDGIMRNHSWRHTNGFPILVSVARPLNDVLTSWRRQARIIAGISIVFALVVVVGSWLLAYTLRDKLRAEQELTHLASTDPLTHVNNRRAFEQRLQQEWGRARRNRTTISALFADIDHFKLFNDTYGHAAGDDVLANVARCIASAAHRSTDVVGRYGGEEFTVILPDTDQQGAIAVAESIRQKVLDLDAINEGSATGRITVSVGCATYGPVTNGNPDDLLDIADQQMYLAKTSGRNQVKSIAVAELPLAAVAAS